MMEEGMSRYYRVNTHKIYSLCTRIVDQGCFGRKFHFSELFFGGKLRRGYGDAKVSQVVNSSFPVWIPGAIYSD